MCKPCKKIDNSQKDELLLTEIRCEILYKAIKKKEEW